MTGFDTRYSSTGRCIAAEFFSLFFWVLFSAIYESYDSVSIYVTLTRQLSPIANTRRAQRKTQSDEPFFATKAGDGW